MRHTVSAVCCVHADLVGSTFPPPAGRAVRHPVAADYSVYADLVGSTSPPGAGRVCTSVVLCPARRAAETASIRFLRERILLTRLTRDSTEKEVSITASDIHVLLSAADSNEILRLHDAIFRDVFQKSKERQQAKFLDLLVPSTQTRHERAVDTEKWVVNLSSRTLSPTENSLLKKGMSFAIAPKRIPAVEIVSRVESTIRTLDAESKESIRKDISTVLQQAKPPKPNITGEMHRALETLKKDRDIIVLPADKGRAAVILNTSDYKGKMTDLLSTGSYREIKRDPTDSLSRKLTATLMGLRKKGSLDDNTYHRLRPKRKQPPRIYGLPKIHKQSVPLRPIVSCIGSFAYDLSKFLAQILSPLTGRTCHSVRNSTDFAEFVSTQTISSNELMLSFDVTSLFTNVPIDGACSVAHSRLLADKDLSTRTTLSPDEVTDLLSFVLRSTYFLYNDTYYEQLEGAAMGSPVSAVVANMYMEAFEEQALEECPPGTAPRIWKRYVDDTFIVADRRHADKLLEFMNTREPTIKFTSEQETQGSIAFLDTLVHRDTGGKLSTTIYKKPTHTDQYLAFNSHHPTSAKRGVIRCLYDRANKIITKPSGTASEKRHLRSALSANGYPRCFINKARTARVQPEQDKEEYKSTVVLPYVESIAPVLRRRLAKHNIRVVYKADATIRNHLVRAKDPVPPLRKDGVIYRIPCRDCGMSYIGETGRPVGERLSEHRRDVTNCKTEASAVAEHAWNAQHQPDWKGVKCMDTARHWYTRRVKEAIHIRLSKDNLNRDVGIEFPESWMRCIRIHHHTMHKPKPPNRDGSQRTQEDSLPGPPRGATCCQLGPHRRCNQRPQDGALPAPLGEETCCQLGPHERSIQRTQCGALPDPAPAAAGPLPRPHTRYNLRARTNVSYCT
ncbi:uncharacterized protein [Diadema antillarum]|uniref:uncharacterized protein n=1 Tax=Diadema antillarum TaxID=105358 RepID=UPI003A8AB334